MAAETLPRAHRVALRLQPAHARAQVSGPRAATMVVTDWNQRPWKEEATEEAVLARRWGGPLRLRSAPRSHLTLRESRTQQQAPPTLRAGAPGIRESQRAGGAGTHQRTRLRLAGVSVSLCCPRAASPLRSSVMAPSRGLSWKIRGRGRAGFGVGTCLRVVARLISQWRSLRDGVRTCLCFVPVLTPSPSVIWEISAHVNLSSPVSSTALPRDADARVLLPRPSSRPRASSLRRHCSEAPAGPAPAAPLSVRGLDLAVSGARWERGPGLPTRVLRPALGGGR